MNERSQLGEIGQWSNDQVVVGGAVPQLTDNVYYCVYLQYYYLNVNKKVYRSVWDQIGLDTIDGADGIATGKRERRRE